MINPVITFHGDSKPLLAALSELRSLLSTGSELEIDGLVTCEELRPDLSNQWAFLRGTERRAA